MKHKLPITPFYFSINHIDCNPLKEKCQPRRFKGLQWTSVIATEDNTPRLLIFHLVLHIKHKSDNKERGKINTPWILPIWGLPCLCYSNCWHSKQNYCSMEARLFPKERNWNTDQCEQMTAFNITKMCKNVFLTLWDWLNVTSEDVLIWLLRWGVNL